MRVDQPGCDTGVARKCGVHCVMRQDLQDMHRLSAHPMLCTISQLTLYLAPSLSLRAILTLQAIVSLQAILDSPCNICGRLRQWGWIG